MTERNLDFSLPAVHPGNQFSCLQENSCHAIHPRNLTQSCAINMHMFFIQRTTDKSSLVTSSHVGIEDVGNSKHYQ